MHYSHHCRSGSAIAAAAIDRAIKASSPAVAVAAAAVVVGAAFDCSANWAAFYLFCVEFVLFCVFFFFLLIYCESLFGIGVVDFFCLFLLFSFSVCQLILDPASYSFCRSHSCKKKAYFEIFFCCFSSSFFCFCGSFELIENQNTKMIRLDY